MVRASRLASGTPRVRMPTSASSSRPRLRSRISWAMRARLRAIRWASRTIGIEDLFASSPGRVKECWLNEKYSRTRHEPLSVRLAHLRVEVLDAGIRCDSRRDSDVCRVDHGVVPAG